MKKTISVILGAAMLAQIGTANAEQQPYPLTGAKGAAADTCSELAEFYARNLTIVAALVATPAQVSARENALMRIAESRALAVANNCGLLPFTRALLRGGVQAGTEGERP